MQTIARTALQKGDDMRRYVLLLLVSIVVVILSQTSGTPVAQAAHSFNHVGGYSFSIEHSGGCEHDDDG